MSLPQKRSSTLLKSGAEHRHAGAMAMSCQIQVCARACSTMLLALSLHLTIRPLASPEKALKSKTHLCLALNPSRQQRQQPGHCVFMRSNAFSYCWRNVKTACPSATALHKPSIMALIKRSCRGELVELLVDANRLLAECSSAPLLQDRGRLGDTHSALSTLSE